MDVNDSEPPSQPSAKVFSKAGQTYQYYLDKWTPHTTSRWVFTFCLMVIFALRVVFLQGWYIVAYALAIYDLNMLLAFLSPKLDPRFQELEEEGGEMGPSLPTSSGDEFRPFVRRLAEFTCWHRVTWATLVALGCTLFQAFNVPVFWPILVLYFFMLFFITMKRQILHMIRYKYVPFTRGKPKYASLPTRDSS